MYPKVLRCSVGEKYLWRNNLKDFYVVSYLSKLLSYPLHSFYMLEVLNIFEMNLGFRSKLFKHLKFFYDIFIIYLKTNFGKNCSIQINNR